MTGALMTTGKTCIIYCRVSSQEQVNNTSLESQERLCREYAVRENLTVIAVFVEEGESAKTANRTEFQKALQLCANKKNPVDFFVVYKIDRFARNQDDHAVTQNFLKRYGTRLRSVTEQIDESPVGRAMEGMLSVFAEFDNNVRSSRSRGGMEERLKKGVWVWPAPIGYTRLTQGGNLVPDENTAPYIQLAFKEYSTGAHTYKSLASFLEKRGLKTTNGKKVYPQLIEKIIKNNLYRGIMSGMGQEYKGAYPALIDDELFWRCQPGAQYKIKGDKREKENSTFPLRGFTVCKICNQPLTASSSTGRMKKKYPYYHHYLQGCSAAEFIPKETFESKFAKYLQQISPNPKYEKIFKAVVIDAWQENYKRLGAENSKIKKQIEILEDELQHIFRLHRTEIYSDEEFLQQKELVKNQIYSKRLLIQENYVEEFNMEEALDYCFKFVKNSATTWMDLSELPILRSRFQKQIFPEKINFDGKEFGTTKMSMILKLNEEIGTNKSHLVTLRGVEPRFYP